jgi:glycosyltransferase involved in cell wall biosynthesis
MKVSIVVVNHNYARFLQQAIDSALAQTYRNIEVVVVDDGSTDDSSEVIKSYGNRIIPIFKENGGQSSCYFRGLAVSSGDLVLYLDADDFLYPRCLYEVVANWRQGDVKAHFYLDVVDEKGVRMEAVVPSGRLGSGKEPLNMMRRFGAYPSPPASGNVFSRDFLTRILTAENESQLGCFALTHADSIPIFAAPFFGRVTTIPKVLGAYRRHSASASGGMTLVFERETGLRVVEKEHEKDLLRNRGWRIVTGVTAMPKMREPSCLKRHFCYLRLAGHGLESTDNRLSLLAEGMVSVISWSGYSWKQKVAVSGWFLAMALLPLKIAEMLIRPALGISHRGAGLRKFLRPRTV